MKLILLFLLISLTANAKQIIDYEKLADAINQHEHSIKFPYGCERRIHGRLSGYSPMEARRICLSLCRRSYQSWNGQGDFFQTLNQVYAADTTNWWRSVEKIYNKQKNPN